MQELWHAKAMSVKNVLGTELNHTTKDEMQQCSNASVHTKLFHYK